MKHNNNHNQQNLFGAMLGFGSCNFGDIEKSRADKLKNILAYLCSKYSLFDHYINDFIKIFNYSFLQVISNDIHYQQFSQNGQYGQKCGRKLYVRQPYNLGDFNTWLGLLFTRVVKEFFDLGEKESFYIYNLLADQDFLHSKTRENFFEFIAKNIHGFDNDYLVPHGVLLYDIIKPMPDIPKEYFGVDSIITGKEDSLFKSTLNLKLQTNKPLQRHTYFLLVDTLNNVVLLDLDNNAEIILVKDFHKYYGKV